MRCGSDANAATNGSGCGKTFNWEKASKYEADYGYRKTVEELQIVKPEKAFEIKHEIIEGVPFPCDICRNNITGPLIRCLNCPSLSMCLQCHTNIDLNGKNTVEGHQNSHICKVVFK
jgi:hypothetical protein